MPNPKTADISTPVTWILICIFALASAGTAIAQETDAPSLYIPDFRQVAPPVTDSGGMSAAVQILILLTVLSLAPALLIMLTCFTRIIIVLGLLRQALATQQLPPNQVLTGLALFMTFMIMAPTWARVQNEAMTPYLNNELEQGEAFGKAMTPIREFMIRQIEAAENEQDVYMFLARADNSDVKTWKDVPDATLISSFITSELKTAFIIGFRIYLPFLVIDMVIASVLISMGMMMLPPMLISLPFKLLLFVLVDGWHLVVRQLLFSFS